MLFHTEVMISEVMITFESVTHIRTVLPISSIALLVALVRHKYTLGKHLSEVLAPGQENER